MAVDDDKVDVFEGFEDHTDASNHAHPVDDKGDDDPKKGDDEAGDDEDEVDGNDEDEDIDSDELDDEDDAGDDDAGDEGDDAEEDEEDEDGEEDSDEGEEDANEEDDEKPKKRKLTPQQRINQIRRKAGDADRRADLADRRALAAEERLAALEKKLTTNDEDGNDENVSSSTELVKPDLTDTKKYPYGELDSQYQEDLADYRVDKKLAERDQKRDKKEKDATAQSEAKEWQDKYSNKIDEGKKAYADFEDVVVKGADNEDYPLTPETAMMVLDSPVGHHVAYKIATSPKLAKKMAQMSLVDQAKQFGRLEARFSTKTPKNPKPPGTPPPPSKKKGRSGTKQFDVKTGSFEEFEKEVNAQDKRRNR